MRTLIQYSEGKKNVQYDLAGSLQLEAMGGNLTWVGQCIIVEHGTYYQTDLELDIVHTTKFYLETR